MEAAVLLYSYRTIIFCICHDLIFVQAIVIMATQPALELQHHLLQRLPRAVQDVDSRQCRCIDNHHQWALARGLIIMGLRL